MTRIIEVAKFRVRPHHEEELVREHPQALAAIQRAFPGLLRVRLVHLGSGTWADVAEWADAESAEAAKQGAMSVPDFVRWTRCIEADLSLDHGIVESTVERRAPGSPAERPVGPLTPVSWGRDAASGLPWRTCDWTR